MNKTTFLDHRREPFQQAVNDLFGECGEIQEHHLNISSISYIGIVNDIDIRHRCAKLNANQDPECAPESMLLLYDV